MRLATALKKSDAVEIYTDGPTIVIEQNYEQDGFNVKFQNGAMPPYSVDHADTLNDAKQIIAQSDYANALTSSAWTPVESD